MYSGRIVEQGTLDELFYDPLHPYSWGLLGSITRVDRDRSERLAGDPRGAAVAAAHATGLPLPPAMRPRVRPLHRGSAARARAFRKRPSTRSLLARARAEARAANGRRPDRPRQPGAGDLVSGDAGRCGPSISSPIPRRPASPNGSELMEVEHLRSSSRSSRASSSIARSVMSMRSTTSRSRSMRARRSGSSASRAAARRR